MANASPQEPTKYVPPPVPEMEFDEDLIGNMEGGRRRREEAGKSAWFRFKSGLRVMWGRDL